MHSNINSRRNSQDSVEIILSPRATSPLTSTNLSNPTASHVSPQQYKYLCTIDLEASLNTTNGTHEMTEFPLLLLSTLSPSLPTLAQFHTFILPQRNPSSISHHKTPRKIHPSSPPFPLAWKILLQFLTHHGVNEDNAVAITCGDWDLRAMLPTELLYHGIENIPLFQKSCNIKQAFTLFTGKNTHSMIRMLNLTSQPLIGTHHSGIDDARNISRIARWLYESGHVFKITSEGLIIDNQDLLRQEMLKREKEESKRVSEEARVSKLEVRKMEPQDMLRDYEVFARWDGNCVPTHWRDGTQLSKSAGNKRRKMWKAQVALHEKYLMWRQTKGSER